MRAAMIGGGAYAAGKHVQAGREQEAQLAEMQEPQEQDAPPPPQYAAPAPAPAAVDPITALTQAKELLDAGVLTQEEFDAQKQRILGGS